jgi:hypothetical protein
MLLLLSIRDLGFLVGQPLPVGGGKGIVADKASLEAGNDGRPLVEMAGYCVDGESELVALLEWFGAGLGLNIWWCAHTMTCGPQRPDAGHGWRRGHRPGAEPVTGRFS